MFVSHLAGLFTHPDREWAAIAEDRHSLPGVVAGQVMILALIPALAFYYGVTEIGWTLPTGDRLYRMTTNSTVIIIALFYWAMVVGTAALGYGVHWMAKTYGSDATLTEAMTLAAYTNTPLFLAGILGLRPILWLDLIAGTLAACYAVYLLYLGIPHLMRVPKERGYLFASAALAVALVMFIALMASPWCSGRWARCPSSRTDPDRYRADGWSARWDLTCCQLRFTLKVCGDSGGGAVRPDGAAS